MNGRLVQSRRMHSDILPIYRVYPAFVGQGRATPWRSVGNWRDNGRPPRLSTCRAVRRGCWRSVHVIAWELIRKRFREITEYLIWERFSLAVDVDSERIVHTMRGHPAADMFRPHRGGPISLTPPLSRGDGLMNRQMHCRLGQLKTSRSVVACEGVPKINNSAKQLSQACPQGCYLQLLRPSSRKTLGLS
jgi:hypothetical protein